MSDHLRPTSLIGRSQPISRPDWPWAARTYSQGSPQRSPYSSGSVLGSNLQSGWDPRASVTSNSSQSGYPGANSSTPKSLRSTMRDAGESTRQWTFMVRSPCDNLKIWSPNTHEPRFLLSGIWMGCSRCSQTKRFCWGCGTSRRWRQFRNTQTIPCAWRQQI